jgi:CheY-like chemotaxis protein
MLQQLGYRVAGAADGSEAIAACRQAREAGEPYDVVILDLTVPGGMGGVETLRAVHDFWPEVLAVASSGYSTDAVMSDPTAHGFRGAIAKPYSIDGLAQCLGKLLRQTL